MLAAREYLDAHKQFTIPVITAMEIASGLRRKQAEKQLLSFEAVLAQCDVIPFDVEAALGAAAIDAALRLRGTPVGLSDIMIASIALQHRYPLVTGNTLHFETIRTAGFGLRIGNWRN